MSYSHHFGTIGAQIQTAVEHGSLEAHEHFRSIVFEDWLAERRVVRAGVVSALAQGWQVGRQSRMNFLTLCASFDRVQWAREVLNARPDPNAANDFRWMQTQEQWLNQLCKYRLHDGTETSNDLVASAVVPITAGSADLLVLAMELGKAEPSLLQRWADLSEPCAAVILEAKMRSHITNRMSPGTEAPAAAARARRPL